MCKVAVIHPPAPYPGLGLGFFALWLKGYLRYNYQKKISIQDAEEIVNTSPLDLWIIEMGENGLFWDIKPKFFRCCPYQN